MADSYVAVRDEPRHRRRFEDGLIRVYDVLVPPGDTTLYHHHTEDTFYVAVRDATVRDQMWGSDEPRVSPVAAGMMICRPHRSRPLIHQVTNVGEADMRMIGAEVKMSPPVTTADALEVPGHKLVVEREQLRAYEVALGPGESTGPIEYGFASMLVWLSIATVLVRPDGGGQRTSVFAPGDVVWQPEPVRFTLTNVGEEPCRAALGEWR